MKKKDEAYINLKDLGLFIKKLSKFIHRKMDFDGLDYSSGKTMYKFKGDGIRLFVESKEMVQVIENFK